MPEHREQIPVFDLGAGVCIVDPEDRLFVLQQERGGFVGWTLPGGTLEPAESIEACAVREAFEETGLRVRLERLVTVDEFWHAGLFTGVGFTFLAMPDFWPQQPMVPVVDGATRFLDHRWTTRDEIASLDGDENWLFWVENWPADILHAVVRRLTFER
jgi:8-oxo-dGTP pyrophosphatase MutT (NUDIX family)